MWTSALHQLHTPSAASLGIPALPRTSHELSQELASRPIHVTYRDEHGHELEWALPPKGVPYSDDTPEQVLVKAWWMGWFD